MRRKNRKSRKRPMSWVKAKELIISKISRFLTRENSTWTRAERVLKMRSGKPEKLPHPAKGLSQTKKPQN